MTDDQALHTEPERTKPLLRGSAIRFVTIGIIVCVALAATVMVDLWLQPQVQIQTEHRRHQLLARMLSVPLCADGCRWESVVNIPTLLGENTRLLNLDIAYPSDKQPVYFYSILALNGYAGEISLLVTLNATLETMSMDVVDHSETPQYGAAATDDQWQSQFLGITPKVSLHGRWEPITPDDNAQQLSSTAGLEKHQVDAITQATQTSQAVLDGIRDVLHDAQQRFRHPIKTHSSSATVESQQTRA